MKLPVNQIIVGERRRVDYGNLQELAESIRKFGLIQPIVVDAERRLVAGGRRLRAVTELLGWTEIEARDYGTLTTKQLRELELEENLRRKNLTPGESSRQMEELKAVARANLEEEMKERELFFTAKNNSRPAHRPPDPGADSSIAKRIGINETTAHRAKQHVAALTRYPEIGDETAQYTAIAAAKELDTMPEAQRTEKRAEIKEKGVIGALGPLHSRPEPKRKLYDRPAHGHASIPGAPRDDPGRVWHRKFQEWRMGVKAVQDLGGIPALVGGWSEAVKQANLDELDTLLDGLAAIRNDLSRTMIRVVDRQA